MTEQDDAAVRRAVWWEAHDAEVPPLAWPVVPCPICDLPLSYDEAGPWCDPCNAMWEAFGEPGQMLPRVARADPSIVVLDYGKVIRDGTTTTVADDAITLVSEVPDDVVLKVGPLFHEAWEAWWHEVMYSILAAGESLGVFTEADTKACEFVVMVAREPWVTARNMTRAVVSAEWPSGREAK